MKNYGEKDLKRRIFGFFKRVSGFGFRVSGFGFRVSGFGFRVSGFGFQLLFPVSLSLLRQFEQNSRVYRNLK